MKIRYDTSHGRVIQLQASLHSLKSKDTGDLYMQTQAPIRRYFQQHRPARVGLVYVSMLLALVALFFSNGHTPRAFAQSRCSKGDQTYRVAGGDTLSGIAASYNTSWQSLAKQNHISDPSQIYPGDTVCVPGDAGKQQQPDTSVATGSANTYPHGQCTWWADQRYHELHGVYVPWVSGSDAWQWTARAREFGWHVSHKPSIGAIMDLQPWVQGAYDYGHVPVVEQILRNSHV